MFTPDTTQLQQHQIRIRALFKIESNRIRNLDQICSRCIDVNAKNQWVGSAGFLKYGSGSLWIKKIRTDKCLLAYFCHFVFTQRFVYF